MSDFSLSRPPLICVAARVQYARVDAIGSHIPALQEALRLNGYPLADDLVETKTLRIEDRAEAGMNVEMLKFSRWDFANVERTVTIRVDPEGVTLLFTAYDHFLNAEPHYRGIFGMVEKSIPALLPRMCQLRYIGYIPLTDGAVPTDWVIPSLLGMPNVGGLQRQGSFSETRFQSPEGGVLVTRCMSLGAGHPSLPPDLLPLAANLRYSSPSPEPFVLLENLHQRPLEMAAFTVEGCLAALSALRGSNAEVFRASVQPQALEKWK
jgi:uncharacterized protein (TIGR04255 family)